MRLMLSVDHMGRTGDPGALSESTCRHLAKTILDALSKFKS